MGILIAILAALLSCYIIAKASDGFELAADYLGRNMKAGIKGATINAIGSSLPEFFTTFIFLIVLNNADGFAGGLGTTAGSALFNILVIPAVVILAVLWRNRKALITLNKKILLRDGVALLICQILLIAVLSGGELSTWHGLFLVGLYVIYLLILLFAQRNVKEEKKEEFTDENEDKFTLLNPASWKFFQGKITTSKAWGILISSMLIVGLGCHLLVESCIWFGNDTFQLFGTTFSGAGIPVYFVSVLLASAATSVPDTILSVKDAHKGNYADSLSNAIGSNIFDICFALGFPVFLFCLFNGKIVLPQEVQSNSIQLLVFLVLLTTLAITVLSLGKKAGKLSAGILLLAYTFFVCFIVGQFLEWEWSISLGESLTELKNIFTF